jgi:hypothetical protein
MEPRDSEQLSQAEQDERGERLADQLSEQGHRATEEDAPQHSEDPLTQAFLEMHAHVDETIVHALAPLEDRIADLEGQVKDLQRVVNASPDTAEMEDVDSGEA